MIAKIIAYGRDRDEALARLRRAMRETDGRHRGRRHQQELHPRPARPARGRSTARADTGWIDRVRGEGRLVAHASTPASRWSSPASRPTRRPRRVERTRLLETARGGRPQVQHDVGPRGRPQAARHGLQGHRLPHRAAPLPGGRRRAERPASSRVEADLERIGALREPAHRRRPVATAWSPPSHGPVQLVEVDGVTHRVSRDEGGVLRSPAPALVVATPARGRRRGRRRRAGARARVHEDGDGAARAVRGPAQGAARRHRQPGRDRRRRWSGSSPTGDAAEAAADAAAEAPDLDLPADVVDGDVAERAARGPGRPAPRCCSATTSTRGHETRTLAGYLAARDELAAAGRSPRHRRDGPADRLRRLRRAEPQPAGRRGGARREPGAQPARALPHLPADPRPRARRPARRLPSGGSSGCCGHYGVDRPRAQPRPSRGRCSGSSSPSSARPPRCRWPPRSCSAGSSSRPRRRRPTPPPASCSTGWCPPPSCASRSSATWPAASGSAGSTSRSSTRTARRCSGRWATSSTRSTRCPTAPSAPPGSTPSPRSPSDRALPRRAAAAAACPRASRCWTCSSSGTTASTSCRPARDHRRRPRRSRPPTTTLDERDSHLVSARSARSTSSADGTALSRLLADLVADRAGRPPGRRRPLPALGRPAGRPGARRPPSLAARLAGMPFASQVRRVAVGVVPDDDREVGYFTFRPQPDGSMDEDRPVRDVHPMVGRRLNLWRLRDFELTRLEAPEDVLLLHAVAAGNPQDQRLVALAQVRQLVVVRDETGKVTALPHVERALANCLEAIRRARATLGAGARLDTNHVWLHIWPPVEADLDQLTALQGKVAPDDRRRRHRGGAHRGRDRRARTATPCRSARASPTSRARASPSRSTSRRRPGSRRSTTTPRRSCGPVVVALVYPYELRGDGRRHRWVGAGATTSTTRVGSCRSTGRTARTPPA